MALGITSLAGDVPRESSVLWPLLLETSLVGVVIAALLPWFAQLAAQGVWRDGRFAPALVTVRGLPDPLLPALCATHGRLAEASVRERLCVGKEAPATATQPERAPTELANAYARARRAFLAPLQEAQGRVLELRRQQAEDTADVLALGDAIDAVLAEMRPYVQRYAIDAEARQGPRPLLCAFEAAQVAAAHAGAPRDGAAAMARADAFLLFAAALDAHPATGALARTTPLPDARMRSGHCAGVAAADALVAAAALMTEARGAPVAVAKNDAMRALLATAGWQWAIGALIGLALLHASRLRCPPAVGVGLALAIWAGAAWLARVPWPFGTRHEFVTGRDAASLVAMPAGFVLSLLGAAGVSLLVALWWPRRVPWPPQKPASVVAYPGLVLATGIGWLLLLDLSANAHFGNRYLALYHQGHLWLGMLTFNVLAFLRQPLGRGLAWLLAVADGAASRVDTRLGALGARALFLALALAATGAIASLLVNLRQLTSEVGRLWLIVGAAWFFFLRGTPLTERLARSGTSAASLLRYVWPLLAVVLVLVAAMVITRDMGPLLIAAYGAGAFLAASVAMWLHQRSGATRSAFALAVLLFAGWIGVTTMALFRLGSLDDVTAARLENAAAPLASGNDHLALVTWFQRAAPPGGFGPGAVPWCGFGATGACAGVPAQIQSDYTFTALVGMFGWTAAWALTIGCAVWLHAVVRGHGRATRGEPRLVRIGGRIGNDEQGFVSWLCVAWVVLTLCQLAVTVAGNLSVVPLTGVTFPFVSFGMASLVVNMAMLALAANVNATHEDVP